MKQVISDFLADRYALMAFIYGLVNDRHLAEDIFQEVWLRLAKAVENGEPIEKQSRWCRGVARRLIMHHWRDLRDDKVVADSELMSQIEMAFDESESMDDDWAARVEALHQCVGALPEGSKRLLTLRYEDGYSVDDVARSVRQSSVNIMKALSRLRKRLALCIEGRIRPACGI